MNVRHSVPPLFRLALLTGAAIGVHGYHLGADDAAIYLPAVKKVINPALYPFGTEFFLSHARMSQFADVVGGSARLTHLGGDTAIFLWHVVTIFAFLISVWQLASACFDTARARWSAVLMIATLLTIPAAGTALVLMDPYLTARSASTPFTVFAVAALLAGKRWTPLLWLALVALVHPQMAVYAAGFLAILAFTSRTKSSSQPQPVPQDSTLEKVLAGGAALIPGDFRLGPLPPDYRRVLETRTFMFLSRWTWYECVGIVAPLALLYWLGRLRPRGTTAAYNRVSRAAVVFGVFATLVGIAFSSSIQFESFARLQPMRAFHLIYIIFFILLGGLLGEFVLKARAWLWIGLYATIAAGMFLVQRAAYPDSRHVEWPWVPPANAWVSAFLWVRVNTPVDAVFALDLKYMQLPGEDEHGFRAIAERSVLTDYVKDSGVVSLFPQLAPEWEQQQQAQQDWANFRLADFQRLAGGYPVSWVIVQGRAANDLDCRYSNKAVSVCRIPGATGNK